MDQAWKLYLQMDNINLDNGFGLNLYIMSITYYMVITSDNQREVRSKF